MRCDNTLRTRIAQNLRQFEPRVAADASLRRAAVAITVADVGPGADLDGLDNPEDWSSDAALLLTRRSAQLRNHPGQWAFPGGRVDAGETLIETALREMQEEINLALAADRVLGVLDDFVTRSGFAMTPVVVWAGAGVRAEPNPAEVASIHRIPLAEFLREDAPSFEHTDTSDHPILRMPVGSDYIATPTAALIYQFCEVCLAGRDTRVDHYEQPEFAWR
jgi:8-oxo-dGTP pyrophosphatase MutT (NUDIX family)